MRIVAGTARGLRLKAPHGDRVRPTADRVKESVFAVLGDLHEATVADLFAGTGALGLEALSRGAAEVVFVENHPQSIRVLEQNVRHVLKAFGEVPPSPPEIVRLDVSRLPIHFPQYEDHFDIIFADPPYISTGACSTPAGELLLDDAFRCWAGHALLVLEHSTETRLPWNPRNGWNCVRSQKFGSTTISYARHTPEG